MRIQPPGGAFDLGHCAEEVVHGAWHVAPLDAAHDREEVGLELRVFTRQRAGGNATTMAKVVMRVLVQDDLRQRVRRNPVRSALLVLAEGGKRGR